MQTVVPLPQATGFETKSPQIDNIKEQDDGVTTGKLHSSRRSLCHNFAIFSQSDRHGCENCL